MALLVNYEGTYLPPDKLWYLVDGIWKEVITVFENPVQQEIALIDLERITQDQVVAGLSTKQQQLLSKIDGSDPLIPIEVDPVKIEQILQEVEILTLQVDIAKTEQVVITKKLFEQKAQIEYIRLVTEGELALKKIATIVDNPTDWGVIRIAPQSTLDERLEVVIQTDLPTNDRIFNYGLVYYRLYKLNSTELIDDITYLQSEFKRRMDKVSYELNREPTNYIFTLDSLQPVYIEVNQFINSGAKRIEEYLASIRDQQKYILDKIESAKTSMTLLQDKVVTGEITLVDGKILTNVTSGNLQVPLGDKLLEYQNVVAFNELVSTKTLQDIVSGVSVIEDYPGIIKLNADSSALNEKIVAIQDFTVTNENIQNKLVTGEIVFNLEAVSILKLDLTQSQNLFWNSVLGSTSISIGGGTTTYTQTYTSGGMYKVKTDELVSLSTTIRYIINVFETAKQDITLLVTSGHNQPKIISVVDGVVTVTEDIKVELTSKQYSISNVSETNVSDMDISGNLDSRLNSNSPAIISVDETQVGDIDSSLNFATYHPEISYVKETIVSNFDSSEVTKFEVAESVNAFYILQFSDLGIISEVTINTSKVPLELSNDNIVSYTQDNEAVDMVFNTSKVPLDINDFIVSYTQDNEAVDMVFNTSKIILELSNDNIVSYTQDNEAVDMVFNTSKVPSYHMNGYSQLSNYTNVGILNGFEIIEFVKSDLSYPIIHSNDVVNYRFIETLAKSNTSIISQTGLNILEEDNLNIINQNVSEIYMASSGRISIINEPIYIDKLEDDNIILTTNTNGIILVSNPIVDKSSDSLGVSAQTDTNVFTTTITNVDKTASDNKVVSNQINIGVIIN